MRFQALVLDYDGTLVAGDRVEPAALRDIERVRSAGVRVVLVTGRPFFDLIRACQPLERFDAVVAENGGLLYFPRENAIRVLAPPPPPALLRELDRRGVAFQAGRVVVTLPAEAAAQAREAMDAAGVGLTVAWNRDALILLPSGVSKGATVRRVIRELGLSPHDVLAVGDAENDLDLFESCGWSACPADAVPAIRARADWVVPARRGTGSVRAVTALVGAGRRPPARSWRHRLTLGWSVEGALPVSIPAQGTNVLIQGDSLSGKSWLAGGIVERLLAERYAVCVVDPEGDHRALARLPGVTWVQHRGESAWREALDHFDRDPSACVVMDLSTLSHALKLRAVEAGLAELRGLRRARGLPHWILLEEAHYLLHREGIADEGLGLEDGGFCLVTYKASWVRPSALAAMQILLLGQTTSPEELEQLGHLVAGTPFASALATALPGLARGEFVLAASGLDEPPPALAFVPLPRETPHVRHQRKYVDTALPMEKRFVFCEPDGQVVATAGSLSEFVEAIAEADERVLAYHASRRDFSRWVVGVFADRGLAGQMRKIERRWSCGEVEGLREPLRRVIAARYGRPPRPREEAHAR